MAVNINLQSQVVAQDDVLVKQLDDTCVLLNLKNNNYYGLDSTGYAFYMRLVESSSILEASKLLAEDYEVNEADLQQDLINLIQGLLEAEVITLI